MPAVDVLLIDQIELQLEGGADGESEFVEALHDLAQDLAGIGEKGLAFHLVHGHQQLRSGALLPGLHGEGVGDGETDAVGIADVETETGAFDGGAGDVEGKQRSGEVDSFLEDFGQIVALDAFTTHHAIHIRNQKIDELNLRMFPEEVGRFIQTNGTRGYRHDETPLLLAALDKTVSA